MPPRPKAAPRCHGYRRVSGRRQARDGLSLDDQEARIRKYAAERGLPDVLLYTDAAVSGSIPLADRPAGGELLDRVRRGDHVVVTKLDRGWRKLIDFLGCFDNFTRDGVHLHVIDFGGNTVDPTKPTGRAIIQILAVVAQLEREMIGERVADAHAYMREQGLYLNQKVPFGFKAVKNPKGRGYLAVPDPKVRDLMALIVRWRDEQDATFEAIYQHLMTQRYPFPNKNYSRWSPDNVFRLYHAAKKLAEVESGGKSGDTVDAAGAGG